MNLAPKPLSKRALSGRSEGNTPSSSRPPSKKTKENHPNCCRICSEPTTEKEGTAHSACTAASTSLLFDQGKIKLLVKRDEKTHRLSCPRCDASFFSTKQIKHHAKTHTHQSISSTPVSTRPPTSATETVDDERSTVFSRTRLPSSDTFQTHLLSRYGLVVNNRHHILICLGCQSILDVTNVRVHFITNHKNQHIPTNLQAEINREAAVSYPNLTISPPHPTEPVEEIYGLEEPGRDYYMCHSCNHCFVSKKSFDQHRCTSPNPKSTKAKAQRFIKNTKSPWFPVYSPDITPATEIDRWGVYQSQQSPTSNSTAEHSYSDNFRVLHQFLRRERWLERVEGLKHEDLMHISSYSTQDTAYGGLHRDIYAFLASAQSSLDEPYIRRSIGIRPAEEQEQTTVRFHRDVNKPTLDHYSRIVAGMIGLIHRVILNIDTSYTFPITDEITRACNDFVQDNSPPSRNEGEGSDGEVDEDDLEEESGSSDDEEITAPRHPVVYNRRVESKIGPLLYLLFTQLPTNDNRGQFFSPIYHFLVLSSVRKNGEWAAANTITHTIAAILFTGRLVFAWKIAQLAQEHSVTFSSAFGMLSQYFDESAGSIMPRLYITKRGFTGLQSAEESTFFFNAPDLSGTTAIVGEHTLSLTQIKSVHMRAMDEIEKELDALTFESSHFTLGQDTMVHDSPRERQPGFSFLKHPKNPWNHQPTMVQHIMQTDSLFSRYAYINTTGTISWNSSAIADHMKRIFDLQTKILCNVILSYGEPARGTELASHLLANVSGGSIRNFFVLFNVPVLRASFSKTASITGDKVIYRVPLPRLGRQFVRFVAYLRPLFVEWQKHLNPFMLHNAQHYLFPGLYRPLTSNDVSKALTKYTLSEMGIPLRLRRYRQYMAFITSCNQDVFDAVSSTSGATHEQFGHTAKINLQHYGQDSRTPEGTNFSSFTSAARVSGVFHMLYGHPPELLQRLEYGQGHILRLKDMINSIRNRHIPPLPLPTTHSTLDLQDITSALKQLILPEITSTLVKSVSQSHASVIELLSPGSTYQTRADPLISPHPYLLAKLRELNPALYQSNGGFKTAQQAQATQLLFERKQNVVYIAPTGSGKTMPNTLCTKYLDGKRSTIWILPLVALHEQHHHTSRRFGLTSESWSNHTSSENPPANILATIDQATYTSFQKFVERLAQQDLLARINVDEAHLILTHASFRPVMSLVQWVASSQVQIVLTTATLPPSLEPSLLSATGITSSITLRAMTPRSNISIKVIRAQTTLEDAVENEYCKALSFSSSCRIILFCLTKQEVEGYSKSLAIPYCHSGLDSTKISQILERFRSDESSRGLVTTSILGVGLDVPDVSHVIHANFPRDVISFVQEGGRAGRSQAETRAFSIVILPPLIPPPSYPSPDLFGHKTIVETLLNETSCRRVPIQTFLDGVGEPCTMLAGSTNLCDNCERASCTYPEKNEEKGGSSSYISLTAAHSRGVYTQPFALDETSIQLEMGYRLLNHYSADCISCAVTGLSNQPSHLFHDCEELIHVKDKWNEFKTSAQFLRGTCYQCGIPQKLNYINNHGEVVYYHDFLEDGSMPCRYARVTLPLLFTIQGDETLHQFVLKSHLEYRNLHIPLIEWVTQLDAGVPNIVAILLLFSSHLVPRMQ